MYAQYFINKLIIGIYIIIRYLALKDVSVMSVPYDPFIFHKFGAVMDFENFEPKMESRFVRQCPIFSSVLIKRLASQFLGLL